MWKKKTKNSENESERDRKVKEWMLWCWQSKEGKKSVVIWRRRSSEQKRSGSASNSSSHSRKGNRVSFFFLCSPLSPRCLISAGFLFNIRRCRRRYEITVSSWDMMISLMSRISISLLSTPHIHVVFTVLSYTSPTWILEYISLEIAYWFRISNLRLYSGPQVELLSDLRKLSEFFYLLRRELSLVKCAKKATKKKEKAKKVKSMNARNIEQFECSFARISQHLAQERRNMDVKQNKKKSLFCYIRNGQQQSDNICRKTFLFRKIHIIIHIYRPSAPLCVCSVSHLGSSEVARILNVK